MVRVIIKGGVWKNTEDEILKAAVMKYGLNQWARISSLLARKSAKHCKQRWYEWLDPAVKKTEWTREEEEKLLHLAKIMPTQWRTIGPLVGRTAAQCLSHYEKLLDQAQTAENDMKGGEKLADPRKHQKGDIDPNPETRPARPDPVDMDDDEKEMISEAMARLTNTRGKKAKRIAREKQLEEAHKLAYRQKQMELASAGIDFKKKKKNKKRKHQEIDYNEEIPFQKLPARGFYDTSSENTASKRKISDKDFVGKDLREIDDKQKSMFEESERKKDVKRQKLIRKQNLPESVKNANKRLDPNQVRVRSQMVLPAPQVSDMELEQVGRLEQQQLKSLMPPPSIGGGSSASNTLLNVLDHEKAAAEVRSARRTPMRTPLGRDTVLEETQNLIAMSSMQTPLMGGDSANLTGDWATPAPMGAGGATPSALLSGAKTTSSASFMRSVLEMDAPAAQANAKATKSKLKQRAKLQKRRSILSDKFAALPAPENVYDLVMPDVPSGTAGAQESFVEDAEVVLEKKARMSQQEQLAALSRRSQVLKMGLPRPVSVPDPSESEVAVNGVQQLVSLEARKLLYYDSIRYPVAELNKRKQEELLARCLVPYECGPDELERARRAVEEQLAQVGGTEQVSEADLYKALVQSRAEELLFVPSKKEFQFASTLSKKELQACYKQQFHMIKGYLELEQEGIAKLVKNANIVSAGLRKRGVALCAELAAKEHEFVAAETDAACFQQLHEAEHKAAASRLQYGVACVQVQKQVNVGLQAEWQRQSL